MLDQEKRAERRLLTIPQAAELMGLSRCQAWRRLTSLNGRFPELRILHRCGHDGRRARYLVSPSALRRVLLDDDGLVLSDLQSRVGILEADSHTTELRVQRVEKAISSGIRRQ